MNKKDRFIKNWYQLGIKEVRKIPHEEETALYNELIQDEDISTVLEWKKEAVQNAINDEIKDIPSAKKNPTANEDEEASIQSIIEAPRYAKIPDKLKLLALKNNCSHDIQTVKHFFKETIWFKFKGKLKDINNLKSDVRFIASNE